jgi:hypothetical protein
MSSPVIIHRSGTSDRLWSPLALNNIERKTPMKTSKYFLMVAAFVLLAGLGAGVMAQGKMKITSFRLPPEPVDPVVTTVNAIEVTDGALGYDSQTKQEILFGYSFLGRTTGAFPGSFTLSMNCTPLGYTPVDNGGIVGLVPVQPPPTEIKGGSWTLPVYMTSLRSTSYAGSLYGTIAQGTMDWDSTGTNANVYIVLNVTGGTQTWENVGGYATFTGTLVVDEITHKTTMSGTLVFNIISAYVE